MSISNFDTWMSKQFADGLVDIKFAVWPGKGVSVQAIQDELLAAEAMLAAGFEKSEPRAISMIPENIHQVIMSAVV